MQHIRLLLLTVMVSAYGFTVSTQPVSNTLRLKGQIGSAHALSLQLPFETSLTPIISENSYVSEGDELFIMQHDGHPLTPLIHQYFQNVQKLDTGKQHMALQQALYEIEAISKNSFLEAKQQYDSLQMNCLKSYYTLNNALKYFGLTIDDIEPLSELSPIALSEFVQSEFPQRITAPQSGVITSSSQGSLSKQAMQIKPNSVFASILSTDRYELKLLVSSDHIAHFQKSMTVDIHLPNIDDPIKAEVSSVSLYPENLTGPKSYRVTCEFDAQESTKSHIRLGMDALVHIETDSKDRMMVPFPYVQTIMNQNIVYVSDNGTILPRVVTLGITRDKDVEILSGLSNGEEIIEHR